MAVIALMLVPGPDMAYCIASGLSYGKRGAVFAALGVGLGGLVLTGLSATLIYAVADIDDRLIKILQISGCLYLIYIGFKIIQSHHVDRDERIIVKANGIQMLLRGIVTNISNPKALIFFLSFIPQFIPTGTHNPAMHTLWLGCLLCMIGTIINCVFGIVGASITPLNRVVLAGRSLGQIVLAAVFLTIALFFLFHIVSTGVLFAAAPR